MNAHTESVSQEAEIVQGVVNAENNTSGIAAFIPLQRVLHTIFGLTWAQCVAVAADGYEDFMDFENIQSGNIEKWISAAINININRVVYYISVTKEKRIQDL